MLFESKKIGRFSLSISFIEKEPKIIMELFSKMIIIEALIRPSGSIEYTAICDAFEERTEGCEFPRYYIDFKIDKKIIKYEIRRMDK